MYCTLQGLTLQKGLFTGKAVVMEIEKGSQAHKLGVQIGDQFMSGIWISSNTTSGRGL